MKLVLIFFGALAGTLYSGLLLAVPNFTPLNDYELFDSYWRTDEHGRGDVIGNHNQFGIQQVVFNRFVETDRINLLADIYTGFIAKSGVGLFPDLTFSKNGIGLGDLSFSSAGWNPITMMRMVEP
jgi:hypothetical protein